MGHWQAIRGNGFLYQVSRLAAIPLIPRLTPQIVKHEWSENGALRVESRQIKILGNVIVLSPNTKTRAVESRLAE